MVDLTAMDGASRSAFDRNLLIGRLQRREAMGLAQRQDAACWQLRPNLEPVLRQLSERGDIVRTSSALSPQNDASSPSSTRQRLPVPWSADAQ